MASTGRLGALAGIGIPEDLEIERDRSPRREADL
jgi:hypothetical protein